MGQGDQEACQIQGFYICIRDKMYRLLEVKNSSSGYMKMEVYTTVLILGA